MVFRGSVALEHFSFFRSRLHRQAFASLARAMIFAKEAGDGGIPMARTARAAFTKSSPVPVWLQYFEKCPKSLFALPKKLLS